MQEPSADRGWAAETVEPLIPLLSLRYRSLADLVLGGGQDARRAPLLLGTVAQRQVACDRNRLHRAVLELDARLAAFGIAEGDTICLLRLPRTSEAVVAVTCAALAVIGVRVLLPMFPELEALPHWCAITQAKAVLWSRAESALEGLDPDRAWLAKAEALLDAIGVPRYCLEEDLGMATLLGAPDSTLSGQENARLREIRERGDSERQCLILSTTGTSGDATLVCYTERALLTSCAAWEAAGLFEADRLGGRGLCLLLSHSMGVRALWNAVWTGQPLCLIPPEWFHEHPARVCTLLREMRPEHVTGGPAVYRALLELVRVFPDLKDNGLGSLRTIVSSGAQFDAALSRRIEGALGLRLADAFGTTQTMQVLSTLVSGPFTEGLGNPLPGVRLRLEQLDGDEPALRRLLVQSAFSATHCIGTDGRQALDGWIATGDLVERTPGGVRHVGREQDEFMKDGFGVKVSRALLARRYGDLGQGVLHVECVPLREDPGLAAIIFVEPSLDPGAVPGEVLTSRAVRRAVRSQLEARHEALQDALDDFEVRHLTVARFACVSGLPPRTAKGDVSRRAIERDHASLLAALTGPLLRRPGIERFERADLLRSNATRFSAPRVGEMLRLLRLDKDFIRGNGDRLTWRERGEEHEAVDFVGGFGVNLLGHNRPELIEAATRFLASGAISLADQGSARRQEGELARVLSSLVSGATGRSFVVRFASTGAEAMEMALAHAMLERLDALERLAVEQAQAFGGRQPRVTESMSATMRQFFLQHPPVVLALDGAFHGHALGARSVSGHRPRARYAPLMGIETRVLAADGSDDLDALLRSYVVELQVLAERNGVIVEHTVRLSRIIAAVAEPIRGEGGVRVHDPALLHKLARCEFPLILDEIQCGLGRAGRFLASEGIPADYYLLGKALGGGLAKLSALLIDRSRYRERFDEDYTSTFAGDAFSCAVGRAVVDLITREDVPARAASRGRALRARLDAVQRDYPAVIESIEGEGLMLGVVLSPRCAVDSVLLRFAVDGERLGLLAASYLLNRWHVRVLPTLSAPNTLRIEPSAWVDDDAIATLERGLRAFARAVVAREFAELLGALADPASMVEPARARTREATSVVARAPYDARIAAPSPGAVRVAFLKHLIVPERDLAFLEPSLQALPIGARRALYHRLLPLLDLKPTVSFAQSLFDGRLWFESILLPVDPATIEALHRAGDRRRIVERIQEGLALAARHGCCVAGLGAYTSIVTGDGRALQPPPQMRLTTGNTLTVAVGARRVIAACDAIPGFDAGAATLGVVGAAGNIGRALAWRLAFGDPPFRRLILFGRDSGRLEGVAAELRHPAPSGECAPVVCVAESLDQLRGCDVIVSAAGTNEPLVFPRHLRADRPVIVADLSVPGVISPAVWTLPHVRVVSLAGTVDIPGAPDFVLAGHIPAGTAFACAGETMLLGLAPEETSALRLIGAIDPTNVTRLEALAERYGMLGSAVPAVTGAQ